MNLSPHTLEFSRNKNISSHLPRTWNPYKHSDQSPKKVPRSLPPHWLNPGSMQWESGALLMHNSVAESGRPIKVLFNFLLMAAFLMSA